MQKISLAITKNVSAAKIKSFISINYATLTKNKPVSRRNCMTLKKGSRVINTTTDRIVCSRTGAMRRSNRVNF